MATFNELIYFAMMQFGMICAWAIIKGLSDD